MHTRLTFLDVGLVDKPELDETVMDEPALDKRVVQEPALNLDLLKNNFIELEESGARLRCFFAIHVFCSSTYTHITKLKYFIAKINIFLFL